MNNRLRTFWFIFALGVTMPRAVFALDLNYSGRIVDNTGTPLQGPLDIKLRFFGSQTGSDQLGDELSFAQVPLVDGVFQIPLKLDAEAQAEVFGDGTRQVFVEMEALGKVYPRQSFAPVPLALRIPIDTGHFEFAGEASKLTLRPLAIEQVLGLREELDNKALPTTISDNKLATITAAGKVAGSAITAGTISGSTAFAGSGGVTTTGPIVSSGHVTINSNGGAATELRFADQDGSHYLGFKAPATVSTNRIWTLPAGDGAAGSFLKTDGEGNLAWITADGGGDMYRDNNLSDVPDKPLARTNLGLGSMATLSIIDSLAIANETVIDADIAGSANIATSKLSGSVLSIAGHGLGSLASKSNIGSTDISDLSIINADISPSAAIATEKLSGPLLNVANHGLGALAALSEVGSGQIAEQSIVNADIASQAGISTTKLSGTAFAITNHGLGALASASSINSALIDNGVISNVHIATSAAIATSKLSGSLQAIVGGGLGTLATMGSVSSAQIDNSSIMNLDIAESAAIATSKLSGPLAAVAGNGLGPLATRSSVGNDNIEAAAAIDATKIADGSVSSAEFQYLSNVTSDVQTQLNAKVNAANPTFTGVMSVDLGSAAAPSYTFAGDTNTGLWSGAADSLSMGTAGSERMTITGRGNVGIGTTAPGHLLDVAGSSAQTLASANTYAAAHFFRKRGATGDAMAAIASGSELGFTYFQGWDGTSYGNGALILGKSTEAFSPTAHGSELSFWTAPNGSPGVVNRMVISNSGNVGIGMTNPAALLHLWKSTDDVSTYEIARFTAYGAGDTSTRIMGGSSNANRSLRQSIIDSYRADANLVPIVFTQTNSGGTNERMRISATGNVGIGTTSPASKLSVNGNASIGTYSENAAPTNGLIVSGNVGIGTIAPTATLHVSGTTRLGTDGRSFSSMGACTTVSTSITKEGTNMSCTGVPASTAVAVSCSNVPGATSCVFSCRATGTANQINCNNSSDSCNSQVFHCLWVKP